MNSFAIAIRPDKTTLLGQVLVAKSSDFANDRLFILAIIDKLTHNKTPMTTTLNFNQTFEQLCEQAISTRQPVEIQQEGRNQPQNLETLRLDYNP